MRRPLPALLVSLTLVLVACSAARGTGSADAKATDCDAAKVDYLIGENISGDIVRKAQQESGAEAVRILKPDTIVTMEFNPKRLNIHIDPGKVIIKLACG